MSQTKIQGSFLTDNTVGAGKLQDDAVTGDKLADTLTISSNSTFSGSVTFANAAGIYTNPVIDFTNANTVGLTVTANWIMVNANRNLESGNNYFANTRNTLTLTLPTSAEIGDTIRIIDNEGFASSNNVTISRNGHLIQGQSANLTINTSRSAFGLVYSTAGNGWLLLEN